MKKRWAAIAAFHGSRKIAPEENCPPSPNFNANPKPNPDPDQEAIFWTPFSHTQRPGNYSICLLGQKNLIIIFVMKTNQVLRPFSTTAEQYANKED